jgi:hypothetical protein
MTVHIERSGRCATRALAPLAFAAVAAFTIVGCSSQTETPAIKTTTIVTATPAANTPVAPAPQVQATTTVTVAAPPPATVTVQAPPPPLPPLPKIQPAIGPFQSPSGNVVCSMFTQVDGTNEVHCAAGQHDWTATQPANCQANWGDRIDLQQGGPAHFGCYGQDMPAPQETLGYGQGRALGTLVCVSESTGMTCTDASTGHFFRVSRETYQLG